jgi:N utilization substance protein B
MQPRRIARELALLSLSQLPSKPERLSDQSLQDLLVAAVRTLGSEVRDLLEQASAELKQSDKQLMGGDLNLLGTDEGDSGPKSAALVLEEAQRLRSAQAMLEEAVRLAQSAVNRLGSSLELPELIQVSQQPEVQAFALDLVRAIARHRSQIDAQLDSVMVGWHLNRLPRIDQDILRLSVAEMLYLGTPEQVAINEAVELAKRYSDEEGQRFLNGVLRRFRNSLHESEQPRV